MNRPIGIIVTFPRVFFEEVSTASFVREFLGMNNPDYEGYWLCKIGSIPRQEVLYCYIIINNRIRYRANIAGFEPGGPQQFDGRLSGKPRIHTAKAWMQLTGPIVKAPYRMEKRGFQGFRYTEELW